MLFLLVGCASRPSSAELPPSRFVSNPTPTPASAENTLFVIGSFTGEQEAQMVALLDRFSDETGIQTLYRGNGEVAELLRQSVEAGQTPDIIFLPKANWLHELADAGAIMPLAPQVAASVRDNFRDGWEAEVTHNDTLYGVPFDANLKSLLWHRYAELFVLPNTFDTLKSGAEEGHYGFTVTGGAGWMLTDWFENILLATVGVDVYDGLIQHEIAWSDPRVITAAQNYVELLQPDHILGGTEGATLPLDESAFERTFMNSQERGLHLWLGQGSIVIPYANRVGFDDYIPALFPTDGTLIVVGSIAVGTNQRTETNQFLYYLTQARSVEPWVQAGGFVSPQLTIEPSAYPLWVNGFEATYLVDAQRLRGDLSDQIPPHLSTYLAEQLREMLRRPDEIEGILAEIEVIATREQGRVPP